MLLEALETLVGYISLHGEHPSVSTEGSWRWELLAVVASFAALYASHLLQQFLSRDSPKKRRAALRWRIPILSVRWVFDSAHKQCAADPARYVIANPHVQNFPSSSGT